MKTTRLIPLFFLPLTLMLTPALSAEEGRKPSELAEEIRELALEIAANARAEAARARKGAEATAHEARREAFRWVQSQNAAAAVPRPFLGVVTEPLPTVLRDYIDIPAGEGLLLKQIVPDGPAAQAGLESNDILLRVNDRPVNSPATLSGVLRDQKVGDDLKLRILRRGETLEKTATLGSRPAADGRWESLVGDIGQTGSRIVEAVQEWIPGSVRLIVDEDERITVDLSELRGSLDDMRLMLEEMRRAPPTPGTPPPPPAPPQTERTSAEGTRTTIVHTEKTVLTHIGPDGTATLSGAGTERRIHIVDTNGVEIFEGPLPSSSVDHLPPEARPLAQAILDSLARLQLPRDHGQLDMELEGHPEPAH
ncbi:MAG: PDZ domain-containing protein [Opitutales bacterium]|nr:PDZ domain-containing protein [Opitutales bacterium]